MFSNLAVRLHQDEPSQYCASRAFEFYLTLRSLRHSVFAQFNPKEVPRSWISLWFYSDLFPPGTLFANTSDHDVCLLWQKQCKTHTFFHFWNRVWKVTTTTGSDHFNVDAQWHRRYFTNHLPMRTSKPKMTSAVFGTCSPREKWRVLCGPSALPSRGAWHHQRVHPTIHAPHVFTTHNYYQNHCLHVLTFLQNQLVLTATNAQTAKTLAWL